MNEHYTDRRLHEHLPLNPLELWQSPRTLSQRLAEENKMGQRERANAIRNGVKGCGPVLIVSGGEVADE